MTKINKFAAQSRSMVPLKEGCAPVYRYRPIDRKDAFDVYLTSDPNVVEIVTNSLALFDHFKNHYVVCWFGRSAHKRERYYTVGLSLETFMHFVSWNPVAFAHADGALDCCIFFPRY